MFIFSEDLAAGTEGIEEAFIYIYIKAYIYLRSKISSDYRMKLVRMEEVLLRLRVVQRFGVIIFLRYFINENATLTDLVIQYKNVMYFD